MSIPVNVKQTTKKKLTEKLWVQMLLKTFSEIILPRLIYVLVKPNCLHFVLTANRTFATVPSQKSLIPIIIKANHWRPNLTVE